uniref:Uncharacterized protein n=1 Tax=Lepeophtheirus salmonis TaxID=72036 RepID=A0A0K2T9H4_LEPSM
MVKIRFRMGMLKKKKPKINLVILAICRTFWRRERIIFMALFWSSYNPLSQERKEKRIYTRTFARITRMSIPNSIMSPTRTYNYNYATNPEGYTLYFMSTHERSNRL